MTIQLKELKALTSRNSITIILNTHRTLPNNQKDIILLRNLIKEAETRLLKEFPKKEVEKLIERMNNLADTINHRENIESLILFVNQDIAEFIRLPISVENRVIIDNTFATRDLIRGLKNQVNYFVLVLSKDQARLIEAINDKVVKELTHPFPFMNQVSQFGGVSEAFDATRERNIILEFFNQVDKVVNQARKNRPLKVLISSDQQNYHEYIKVADQPNSIFEVFLARNRQSEKNHNIVSDAWEIVREYDKNKNKQRKAELKKAVTLNKFVSDTNEIYRAIKEGRVQTLFIEQGLFQPAIIENNQIKYVSQTSSNKAGVIDDIYDELIELNMDYGGDVVFLSKGELSKFNGFGAITRY